MLPPETFQGRVVDHKKIKAPAADHKPVREGW